MWHYEEDESKLEAMAEKLRDIILQAVSKSVPLLRISPRSKSWWNEEVAEKRKEMARALRYWKQRSDAASFSNFKAQRNDYFRSIRRAKQESWNDFLNDAKGADIFKALRYCKPRKYQKTPALKHNNRTATTFAEKSKLMRELLFPPLPTQAINHQEDP